MYFQAENLSSALVLLCKELMDKGIDEFILGKLKEGEKAIKENCELITYRGSECA